MKTRLSLFVAALLLLPYLGMLLTGADWGAARGMEVNPPAVLLTSLLLAGYVFWINHLIRRYTGNNLLNMQQNYYWTMAGASAVLGWLLVYLNHFLASWTPHTAPVAVQILLFTPLFALLAPAILVTRAALGALPNLLKRLAAGIPIPAPRLETRVMGLILGSVLGLLTAAVWTDTLFWLAWAAPLLLLVALQGLWHENSVFAGLPTGDWGRVICGGLAGLVVGNFAVMMYQNSGGILDIHLPHPLLNQFGFILFGLLCLQLGDVIAEIWRGKQQPLKKKFPIPVVVAKTGCGKK